MFIIHNDKIVNLLNVSSFKLHRTKNRIIFNMNYSIKINSKITSDYVYFDFDNSNAMYEMFEGIKQNYYFREKFIRLENGYDGIWVNRDNISSIKKVITHGTYTLIINYNYGESFIDKNGKDGITSGYTSLICNSEEQLNNNFNYLVDMVK